GKQVMGLQLAEHSRPLPRPIAQDAGHRQLRIVIEDRLRYAPEEAECGVVPVAKRFGGFRRIGLYKQASLCGRSTAKKWILRSTPAISATASPKSACAWPGSCRSGTKTSSCRRRRAST